MADEVHFSSRPDNKRKFDDPATTPPFSSAARRTTGFSSPIASNSPDAPPPSYSSVPPPPDGIELAKQRAQEIAAKLFSDAEAKRPKTDNGPADSNNNNDYGHKTYSQQMPSFASTTPAASFNPYGYGGSNKRVDIPNGRVGVIIGKGGETIKYLQQQSGGCKIQVTRDADADPYSQTRTVELTGTAEQISKAEKLISDVLAEAEAGGSATSTGTVRKFVSPQVGGEQFTMKVPNNRVGLIIGKGGETIKNMQASSGARIQIIPLHPPPGDTSTERTVQIDGTTEQIEAAKQLVNEVISEKRMRNPQMGGGYSQQGYRPPRPPTNWGPPGPPMQQQGYGYMQPGAYPGQPPQYSQPSYGSYPPQPASGGYSSGWDQSSNTSTQQSTPAAGYDYYSQQQPQQQQAQQPPLVTSSAPADNNSYNNFGQPPAYNSQGSYVDASYPQGSGGQQPTYGQDTYSGGYNAQPPQPGVSQPTSNPQAGYDQGYGSAGYGGTVANPAQDGSAAAYGTSVGAAPTQQGYTAQPPSTASTTYTSSQVGYGQPTPLTQPSYGQSPQAQKPPIVQAGYGQTPPPQTTQAAYAQPGAAQSAYGQQPPAQTWPQSYGQQLPAYGGAPAPSQAGYGQQQQPYADAYGGGGYPQPPVFSSEGSAAPAVPGGVTKASPQS
ncbi:far upstream element-binding protein 2-like [Iris pallida]|uniref:Far upstream element-binding protein 2-like n=1 Tax=Iris pallida TaxID=29817 RepID=A0AAX6FHX9_IRIPA|nr:far upstream element-binding protein 2-like [Iris pallida]